MCPAHELLKPTLILASNPHPLHKHPLNNTMQSKDRVKDIQALLTENSFQMLLEHRICLDLRDMHLENFWPYSIYYVITTYTEKLRCYILEDLESINLLYTPPLFQCGKVVVRTYARFSLFKSALLQIMHLEIFLATFNFLCFETNTNIHRNKKVLHFGRSWIIKQCVPPCQAVHLLVRSLLFS